MFPKLPDVAGIMNIPGLAVEDSDFLTIVNGNVGYEEENENSWDLSRAWA